MAPHIQRLIVDLEQAEGVTPPRHARGTVSRQDEALPKQRGNIHVSDGRGVGWEEAVQQREEVKTERGMGKRHLRHDGR